MTKQSMSDAEFRSFIVSQLTSINQRLDLIRDMVTKEVSPQAEVSPELMAKLQAEILRRIVMSWDASKRPTDSGEITRAFCKRTDGAIVHRALDELIEKKLVMTFTKATGALVFLPEAAREQLDSETVQRLRFHKLSPKAIAAAKLAERGEQGPPAITDSVQAMIDNETALAAAHWKKLGIGGSDEADE